MNLEYVQLGSSELQVSRLCLGCWQAAGWQDPNDKNFKTVLRHALSKGINFLDTAPAYGNGRSEQLIGQVLREYSREDVIIATKFGYTQSAPYSIRKSLEKSLRRLGTEYIDLYQQHWPCRTPSLQTVLNELVALKNEGKIRAIGVCNWMKPEWEMIKDPQSIDCIQPCYNLLWRIAEQEVLPICEKYGMSCIPYSPLAQGLLAKGKIPELLPGDHRNKNRLFNPKGRAEIENLLGVLHELARQKDCSTAQIALRWLLQKPGVTAPIVGASSSIQLDQNLNVFGWSLPEPEMLLLDQSSEAISEGLRSHDSMWNWHPLALSVDKI